MKKSTKFIKIITLLFIILTFCSFTNTTNAQNEVNTKIGTSSLTSQENEASNNQHTDQLCGGNGASKAIVANIVNVVALLWGITSIAFVLFGIISLARNRGDQTKKKHAKINLIIGIVSFVLVLASYVIAALILDSVFKKPVIYLYPEQEQEISVQLDYQGKIIATYPNINEINNGWEVTAYPDGKIINHDDNEEYSYLFWEGQHTTKINWDLSTGFVVKREDTREFLQKTLAKIGLTPKEYNEFIVYWYPLMMKNKYNLIHFADKQYTDTAPLNITPEPDSMLRVFMVYKPLSKYIEIEPQRIKPFERTGFTVVEWGGTETK